nr:hypothetical protein 3 [Balneolaceae bacterium]
MKGLSIRQPWAWLIVNGYKDIENRNWKYAPSYRGQILIHASKTFDFDGAKWVEDEFPEIPLPITAEPFQKGGFVGLCRLNDVVEQDDSEWFFGPLGFKLRMQKPIEFIPFKGQLGLFDVPDSIIQKIKVIK